MTATVVITTRNRKDDLRRCLQSAFSQTAAPQVMVIDDASDDGSDAMVRAEFPQATLIRHATMHGYIRGRNEAARLSSADVIVSIDDDAAFSSDRIVAHALESFADRRVGAVAIPYIDVNRDEVIRQLSPDGASYVTGTFIGTAHAIRRELFVRLGGYREELFHQGEESDFCLRMLAAGYVVRLGSGDPIHHFESPRRDFSRMDHYGPRNAMLFFWQNVPLRTAVWQWPATVAGVLSLTFAPKRFLTRFMGILDGFRACVGAERHPVAPDIYRLWRRLRSGPPPRLSDVVMNLPAC